MVLICESTVQGDLKIGGCRLVGQAISINCDVKFTFGLRVVQMESCQHGFRFAKF